MKKESITVDFRKELSKELKALIAPGSIYEASKFTESLSQIKLSNGQLVSKFVNYKGYLLWWINYNLLFLYYGLPYTQYKKFLEYLSGYKTVTLCEPPYKSLFIYYLKAHGSRVKIKKSIYPRIHLGVFVQIILTAISLPVLVFKRPPHLVFTGDKFERGKDYDFRMKFIYQELRERKMPFVEFVRSLESWKVVFSHFWTRKRPVIYSEAIASLGKILSGFKRSFDKETLALKNPEEKFKLMVATHYLKTASGDIVSIKIMKVFLKAIGTKGAFFTAFTERNAHTILGAKLNNIPTVGILHGLPSLYYNAYDFMPGFNGEKVLTTDKYGLWSDWWKDFYTKNSQAYHPDQLYVSGAMRPSSVVDVHGAQLDNRDQKLKILFIAEQLAVPEEVLPYLDVLLKENEFDLTIKFRPSRDGFEDWLKENKPEMFQTPNLRISKEIIQEAVKKCDVVVGSHSTAVLEALLQFKVPIFFNTHKWGDCFNLKDHSTDHPFFADDPGELVGKIKQARLIPREELGNLQEKYFGVPYQNGSKWVVDELVTFSEQQHTH